MLVRSAHPFLVPCLHQVFRYDEVLLQIRTAPQQAQSPASRLGEGVQPMRTGSQSRVHGDLYGSGDDGSWYLLAADSAALLRTRLRGKQSARLQGPVVGPDAFERATSEKLVVHDAATSV
jgi:hypothetical protein